MPINVRFGNLIKEVVPSKTGNDIIIQQVNAMGVMASGFAKDLRAVYPAVFDSYSNEIKHDKLRIGMNRDKMGLVIPHLVDIDGKSLLILNIVAQLDYGRDGSKFTSYDALDAGFKSIAEFLEAEVNEKINVHFPAIGCGLGGGNWLVVEAIINSNLTKPNVSNTLWVLE